ncbi:MAG: hypothetical protein QM754_14685 [Tepidisphaeraceae bacterium]
MRRLLPVLAAAAFVGGCCVKSQPPKPPYYGPTSDLRSLIDELNTRNARLVSLRAEGGFSADFVDPKTKKHDGGDGDVTLLLMPPQNLRLRGTVFGQLMFDVGANSQDYWLHLPKQDVMYTGTLAAEPNDLASSLPIRPDVLAEVLGLKPISADLLGQPFPTLRFNHDDDCYMLTWSLRLRDRWAVQKEVWYDRTSLVPTRVLLYDAAGRVVLRAIPSQPKPVEGYAPPVMFPSKFELLFTDTGSTFELRLSTLEQRRGKAPSERTFVLPEPPEGTKRESLDR